MKKLEKFNSSKFESSKLDHSDLNKVNGGVGIEISFEEKNTVLTCSEDGCDKETQNDREIHDMCITH